jgi:hypothetical protein
MLLVWIQQSKYTGRVCGLGELYCILVRDLEFPFKIVNSSALQANKRECEYSSCGKDWAKPMRLTEASIAYHFPKWVCFMVFKYWLHPETQLCDTSNPQKKRILCFASRGQGPFLLSPPHKCRLQHSLIHFNSSRLSVLLWILLFIQSTWPHS